MILRSFLYLDSGLVRQFLAQLEGGVYSHQDERLREHGGKEAGGEFGGSLLGARAGVKAGRTSGREEEVQRTVELTPEAEFARLHDLLSASDAIHLLDHIDGAEWGTLRRGELAEVDGTVAVSTIARYSHLVEQVGPFMELMQAMGESVDDETKEAMTAVGMFGSILGNSVPIVAKAAGAPDYRFASTLIPSALRVELDQLDGDATILGKVQRLLGPGDTYTIFDLMPGFRGLPTAQRQELEKDLTNSPEFPDMVVTGPLAVLTPVAVYR
jgi:hypothetical protein